MIDPNAYPFTAGSLFYAVQAAREALRSEVPTPGDPDLVTRGVLAAAPHIGASVLLDFADELYGVEEPLTQDPHEWYDYLTARGVREYASRLLNPEEVHDLPA